MEEDIIFIGYWNRDRENPELLFNIPKDKEKYDMVQIEIKPAIIALKETYNKELNNTRKLNRGLQKSAEALRKIKHVR